MPCLVLLRHGESQWNRDQRFTGWADVDLTKTGVAQMRDAGGALRKAGILPDVAVTSVLRRCVHSLWIVLDAVDRPWVPQQLDWRLNERHYGGLTGLSKPAAVQAYGAEAVHAWRRSFDGVPPPVDARAAHLIPIDARYAGVPPQALPNGESLRQASQRVQTAWLDVLAPLLQRGACPLLVGHGNALRALIGTLETMHFDALTRLEVPNGVPIVYELDPRLRPQSKLLLEVGPPTPSEIL